MTLRIREATARDAVSVVELLRQLGYERGIEAVADDLHRASERVLLAEREGRVVGLAAITTARTLAHDRPLSRITALVVDASARRGGIGRALPAAVLDQVRKDGCEGVELTTGIEPERSDAHRFYEALGFQRTSYRFWRLLQVPGR